MPIHQPSGMVVGVLMPVCTAASGRPSRRSGFTFR
jgi:hypothetical protein